MTRVDPSLVPQLHSPLTFPQAGSPVSLACSPHALTCSGPQPQGIHDIHISRESSHPRTHSHQPGALLGEYKKKNAHHPLPTFRVVHLVPYSHTA